LSKVKKGKGGQDFTKSPSHHKFDQEIRITRKRRVEIIIARGRIILNIMNLMTIKS